MTAFQTNETNNLLLSESDHRQEENIDTQQDTGKTLLEQHAEKRKKNKKSKQQEEKAEGQLDQEKLKEALIKEEESKKTAEKLLQQDERKRSYHSKYDQGPITAEEIEAYNIKRYVLDSGNWSITFSTILLPYRQRSEDPMSAFKK